MTTMQAMPCDEPRRFGSAVEQSVLETIRSGRLFCARGDKVSQVEEKLAERFGAKSCIMTANGTAAVHAALAAVGVGFGDEVITTPITDTGTVIPIVLQGAIPVFADVNPDTINLDADAVEAAVTSRTRAIVAVHYNGNPCEMDRILEIGRRFHVPVIEDACQALGATWRNRPVGAIGAAGCCSTNDSKPLACGDGGFVIAHEQRLARRIRLCMDKGFDRQSGVRNPCFAAPNYRMTELQAAVLLPQLEPLEQILQRRQSIGESFNALAASWPQIMPQRVLRDSRSAFFHWTFQIDRCTSDTPRLLSDAFAETRVPYRYGSLYDVIYRLAFLADTPPGYFRQLPDVPDYSTGMCPAAETILKRMFQVAITDEPAEVQIDRLRLSFETVFGNATDVEAFDDAASLSRIRRHTNEYSASAGRPRPVLRD